MSDLLIRFKLDQKGLDAQMKGVSSQFADLAKGIAKIALPVAAIAAFAKAADGLAAIGEAAINSIAPLQDISEQLGVSAERLQELRAVAGSVGVSTEELDKSIGILNRTIGQAALGHGDFEKTLKSVGISLKDSNGNVKSTEQVWNDLTKAVQSGALTQEQSVALAASAFDRGGLSMIAVLKQTAEEQQKVIDTARQYGAIISNEVVAAADRYGDQLELIKKGTAALNAETELSLAPFTLGWAKLKNEIAGATAASLTFFNMIETPKVEKLKTQIADTTAEIERLNGGIKSYEDGNWFQHLTRDSTNIASAKREVEELRAKLAQLNGELATAQNPAGRTAAGGPSADDLQEMQITATKKELMQSITDFAREQQLQQLNDEIDVSAQKIEVNRSMHDQIAADDLKALREQTGLMIKSVLDEVEENEKATQKKKDELDFIRDHTIASAASAGAALASHSKKMFELNKAAGISQTVIAGIHSAKEALAHGGGYPWGLIPMAADLLNTVAAVNAIKSTTFGSGTTPSAAGTPTVNGSPAQAQATQTISVRGVDPGQFFSGRQVVDLLNTAVKDGAKLVFQP